MLKKLFTLAFVLFCFFSMPAAKAGFWVKHKTEIVSGATGARPALALTGSSVLSRHHSPLRIDNKPNQGNTSGWEGIVSLICGIAGLMLPFLSVAAVIFGILGLKAGKKYHGMALAGIILGGVMILAVVVLVLMWTSGGTAFFS